MKLHCTRTRIAPTPSGFLHIGNLLSFSITAFIAAASGARTLLRIDDLDGARVRLDFIQDIFDTLAFAGIPWQEGPRNSEDFTQHFSQRHRLPMYHAALSKLREMNAVFACSCSRTQLQTTGCFCEEKSLSLDAREVNWRMRTGDEPLLLRSLEGDSRVPLPESMRNCIVRKKDGLPSYQLASVCDDVHFGIDLVVRGEDLYESTLAQLAIAKTLGYDDFMQARFYHHALLSANGGKLSKSAGASSIYYLRSTGIQPAELFQHTAAAAGLHREVRNWKELAAALLPFNFS